MGLRVGSLPSAGNSVGSGDGHLLEASSVSRQPHDSEQVIYSLPAPLSIKQAC